MLLPGNLDEGGQKQCWGFVKAATQQQICNCFAFPPEVLQLKPFCSMSCACSGWGGFTGSCKRHIHCMSEPKLFPVVAGPAYTQEKPFPTQSIPRHFEAIVLPIVGLYCWGGLPYASGQVLFAVQDYSVASVLALFDSVLIFFPAHVQNWKIMFTILFIWIWLTGFSKVLWGFFARVVWTWHITWAVNSVSHVWGSSVESLLI